MKKDVVLPMSEEIMEVTNLARLYVGESMVETISQRGLSGLCILGRP